MEEFKTSEFTQELERSQYVLACRLEKLTQRQGITEVQVFE